MKNISLQNESKKTSFDSDSFLLDGKGNRARNLTLSIVKSEYNPFYAKISKIAEVSTIIFAALAIYSFFYDLGCDIGHIKGRFGGWNYGVKDGANFAENICELRHLIND